MKSNIKSFIEVCGYLILNSKIWITQVSLINLIVISPWTIVFQINHNLDKVIQGSFTGRNWIEIQHKQLKTKKSFSALTSVTRFQMVISPSFISIIVGDSILIKFFFLHLKVVDNLILYKAHILITLVHCQKCWKSN